MKKQRNFFIFEKFNLLTMVSHGEEIAIQEKLDVCGFYDILSPSLIKSRLIPDIIIIQRVPSSIWHNFKKFS